MGNAVANPVKSLAKSRAIIAALITPFDRQGAVDRAALVSLVERVIRTGAGGLYVCGTTGEGFLLSEVERRLVAETAVHASAGRADVIVNISHMDLRQALQLADHAATVGADAVSSLPPIFYGVSEDDQTRYFLALLAGVELPLTIYNIPHLSHRTLSPEIVAAIADNPRLVGIKHTSDDLLSLVKFKQLASGRLIVWCGRDARFIEHLAAGADGAIGSSYQLFADVLAEILKSFRRGDKQRAELVQQRINAVHERLQVYGAIQSIKRCLTLQGINAGDCRLPLSPVRSDCDDFHRATLEMADQVRTDFGIG
jgi:N-acetylneuraminate lyase